MMITPHFRRLTDRLASAPNRPFDVHEVSGKPGRVRIRLSRRAGADLDMGDSTPLYQMLSMSARMAAHTLASDGTIELDSFKLNVHHTDYDDLSEVRARIVSGQNDVLIVEAVAVDEAGQTLAYGKGKLVRYADDADNDEAGLFGFADENLDENLDNNLDDDLDDDEMEEEEEEDLTPISIYRLTEFGLGRGSVLQTKHGIVFLN